MNERIKAIATAATNLFLQQGYAKTQISHIAKAANVSVGTIYLDFTGKKEIMHFVLKSALEPDFPEREFQRPITDDLFVGLETEIVTILEATGREFARHLDNNAADYNLAALVSDAFDLLAKYAVGCLFIEKNQRDFPFLAGHYKAYRQKFLTTMAQYLEIFMARSTMRQLEQVELTTILIIEILSWWTMDRRYISFEKKDIPLSLAKEVCLDNILAAYGV